MFNRPFDDQGQLRIRLESEAKLYIQDQIILGNLQLIWSYILEFENSKIHMMSVEVPFKSGKILRLFTL